MSIASLDLGPLHIDITAGQTRAASHALIGLGAAALVPASFILAGDVSGWIKVLTLLVTMGLLLGGGYLFNLSMDRSKTDSLILSVTAVLAVLAAATAVAKVVIAALVFTGIIA